MIRSAFLGEQGATAGKMKLAFAVLLTIRGTPLIYSGDEIAMTGGDDPIIGVISRRLHPRWAKDRQ